MNIKRFDSKGAVQDSLIEDLANYFVNNSDKPILFFYSGGSAFELYLILYERIKDTVFKELIFAPIDERKDFEHSNYEEFRKFDCYDDFVEKGVLFLHCGNLNQDLDKIATNYDELVKHMIGYVHSEGGKAIGLFGMGADGHTAGIFSYLENREFFDNSFINTEKYVFGYNVGQKNEFHERISLTVPAFRTFDSSYVYVCGEQKKVSFDKAIDGSNDFNEIPSRVWKTLSDVNIYTDLTLKE